MSKEPIHSGHFMTSNPHTEIQVEDEDEDVEVDVVDVDDSTNTQTIEKRSAQFKDEKPVTFYKFGPHKAQSIAIDVSLNKLNKCIKVAYMKMTTPKWKDFKGLKLQWKHRIRLNNVIWRAYYMEFRKPDKKKKTPYCYFAVPDDDTTHTKIEGSVLEGMYWKRRMEGVCAQYKRWRTYNRHAKKKPRGCCRKRENSCGCEGSAQINMPPQSQTPQLLFSNDFDIDDDFDNEFTNSLFDSLNAPFIFPNPKESMQSGNADIIQPGLLSLQPSIEEIMQSMDYPFSDSQGSDCLDAFIDRVSQEPSTSESSLQPPQQHNAYLSQTSSSSASLPRRFFLHPADTNKNSGSRSSSLTNTSNGNSSVGKRLNSGSDAIDGTNSSGSGGLYSAKEYDAANMLIDYSNQKHFVQRQQQQQQQQQLGGLLVINGGGVSEKGDNFYQRYHQKPQQQQEQRGTRANDAQMPFSLVNAHTPQPLYSQAFYATNNDVLANNNTVGGGALGNSGATAALGQVGRNEYFENFVGNQPRRRLPVLQDQRQQFLGLATTSSQTVVPPTTFHNLPQHGPILISSNNNSAFFTTSSNTVPSTSSIRPNNSSSMLTLDQYVLAAAAASVSTSTTAAVISSLSSSMGDGGTTLNSSCATANQLAQQSSQWWVNSPTQQQQQNLQSPLQYNDEQKTLQFLRSPFPLNVHQSGSPNFSVENIQKSINDANLNSSQQQQQRPQFLPFTSTGNPTTAVITLLQNVQQHRSSPLLQSQQQQQQTQHGLKASLEAREKLLAQNSFAQQRSQQQLQQQQQHNGLLSPRAAQVSASTMAQDLQRFLPTNIGISTPSSTSIPTISLSNMLSTAPATILNAGESPTLQSPIRYHHAKNAVQQNINNYSATTLANTGNLNNTGRNISYSGAVNSDISSAAILQFHQQCQQQQQQQQQGYMPQTRSMASSITSMAISMSSPTASVQSALYRNQQKFDSLRSQPIVQSPTTAALSALSTPLQAPQSGLAFTPPQQQQEKLSTNGGLAAHLSGKAQRTFAKTHTKKYSQPNGARTGNSSKPSSSGLYSSADGFAEPPYLKRRSNLSESLSLDDFQLPATSRNFAATAHDTSNVNRWNSSSTNSYDSSDTVRNHSHPPLSLLTQQQHSHQQERSQQMLSPPIIGTPSLKEDYTQASAFTSPTGMGGPAPLARQRQSSASSTSSSAKHLLGINNRMAGVGISVSPSSASPPPPQFHVFPTQHQQQQKTQQQQQSIPHYTEMTNVILSSRRGAPAPKKSLGSLSAAASIQTNSAGGGGSELLLMYRARSTSLSTLTTITAGDKSQTGSNSSASSQFLGETGSGMDDNLSPINLFDATAVKEESEEQQSPSRFSLLDAPQQQKALIPSGSKRRNTMSGILGAGSRSAPADSTLHPEERKRILHLHAEKNRRSALKEGFDALVEVIPFVEQAGVKSTNAVVLNRAATHMRSLKKTSEERAEQVDALKHKIAHLNEKISLLQSNLPSNSRASDSTQLAQRDGTSGGGNAPSMRGKIEQFYERYTKERSKKDYRFWLMSEIFSPIVQSYAEGIHPNASERDRVAATARQWLDRCWNASVLRPLASETLVRVATASGAFTDDNAVPKYIMSQIEKSSS